MVDMVDASTHPDFTKTTMFNSTDDKEFSTRVNSARLADYVSKHVRLPCKVLKVSRILLISGSRVWPI